MNTSIALRGKNVERATQADRKCRGSGKVDIQQGDGLAGNNEGRPDKGSPWSYDEPCVSPYTRPIFNID